MLRCALTQKHAHYHEWIALKKKKSLRPIFEFGTHLSKSIGSELLVRFGLSSCSASIQISEQVDCKETILFRDSILLNTDRLVGDLTWFAIKLFFNGVWCVVFPHTGDGTGYHWPGQKQAQTWPLLDFYCRYTRKPAQLWGMEMISKILFEFN